MRTQAIKYWVETPTGRKPTRAWKSDTGSALQVTLLILAAILPFTVVSVLTIWAISIGAHEFVSAAFWTSGFVFLALMVENESGHRVLLSGSALALMTLAWLSSRVAPEFGVMAGFLLAAWVAAPIVRRLAVRRLAPSDAG